MAETLVEIVHIGVALFMILVVLVQGGNQGGVGAAFGGGNSSGVFGATGATTILGKMTYAAAAIFMITSISLTVMQGKGGDVGLKDRLKQGSATDPAKAPDAATTAGPATVTPGATTDSAAPAAGTTTAPAGATTETPPAANPPAP